MFGFFFSLFPAATYPAAYSLVGQPFPHQPTLVAQQPQQLQQLQQREGKFSKVCLNGKKKEKLTIWRTRHLAQFRLHLITVQTAAAAAALSVLYSYQLLLCTLVDIRITCVCELRSETGR